MAGSSTGGLREKRLTATHGHHHFQFIAVRQLLHGKQTSRHNFAVALQCDAFAGQAQFFNQDGDDGEVGKLARSAVNADGNHL